jgi:hypothetical protein
MIRTFLVTFPCGMQASYDALNAQQLCNHLRKFFSEFTVEVV